LNPSVEFVRGLGERCRVLRGIEIEAGNRKSASVKDYNFHLGRASVYRSISEECKAFTESKKMEVQP
jgi:hypothetical protein